MGHISRSERGRRRGGILLGVLVFVVVTSFLLSGMATLVVSHFERAQVESNYAGALNLADAGANYELQQISQDPTLANAPNSPTVYTIPGVPGSFKAWCTARGASGAAWTPGSAVDIYGIGTVNGITRKVLVGAKPIYATGVNIGNYAIFSAGPMALSGNAVINGDIGTNGAGNLQMNGTSTTLTGSVVFNGVNNANQGWCGGCSPGGNYQVAVNPGQIPLPTVETIANTTCPSGGLTWLATHNDNNLGNPPITGNTVSIRGSATQCFVGKAGGANYYLTSLSCGSSGQISFDNTAGPINIWVGPSGGVGTCAFKGGTAAITTDPSKQVHLYDACSGNITQSGNSELDMGIYDINNGCGGGQVVVSGSPTINGQIIAGAVSVQAAPRLSGVNEFGPSVDHYGYDIARTWTELNPIH